jgi:hypothetical protein
MNTFSTFLLQIAVFLNGGLAIHTLMLWMPDNHYEPTLPKFLLYTGLAIAASAFSFKNTR